MRRILVENRVAMAKEAADLVAYQINAKPDSVLGLATGETPLGLYHELVKRVKSGEISFRKVITFNLDEYVGLAPSHPQSYNLYMTKHYISLIDLNPVNAHIPSGVVDDLEIECKQYDQMIAQYGGIDLQILGIGSNGHIGFNEPSEELIVGTHVVKLTEETRRANARFFNDIAEVPTQAITMGVGSILRAKKIILLVSGETKAPIIAKLAQGVVDTGIPVTLLHLHNDVTVIIDAQTTQL